MEKEQAYIDDKPFNNLDENEQNLSIISTDKNELEIQVLDNSKYSFSDFNRVKTLYVLGNNFILTAFNVRMINIKLSYMPEAIFKSKLFFYRRFIPTDNNEIKHFTENTKIRKLEYYNDSIAKVFKNISIKSFRETKKNKLNKVTIEANNIKERKLFDIEINKVKLSLSLKSNFNYSHNYNNLEEIIKDRSNIIIKFSKGMIFKEIYKYILILDTVFYLMTLNKRRHKEVYLYDYKGNKYSCYDEKMEESDIKVNDKNYLIVNGDMVYITFEKLFKGLCRFKEDSKNAIFPFLNYDIKNTSIEISFLEYYRVLEYLKRDENKENGKGRNSIFIKDVLKDNKELKEKYFKDYKIEELEEEIRSLRNYYSHYGYYINKLPIPTFNRKRDKIITVDWILKVHDLIKSIAYIEIYRTFGINVDWSRLIYYI